MKKLIIIISAVLLTLWGCEGFLDVNEDPNFPKEVDDLLVLPAAQVSIANVFSADWGLLGSFWSQHWAQNNTSSQYKIYETYTFSNNTNVSDRSYRELYIGGLSDNEIVHRNAKENENWGLYLITSTMKAFTFQYLVDLYDNVPYHEAFNGEDQKLNPAIDRGEDVYDSIYALLNDALSKDYSGFQMDTLGDLIYAGDITAWENFANTLKLRILLRQINANPTWATSEITTLLASGSFLANDAALTNFSDNKDDDSKRNPLYESDQKQLNTDQNIRANATFTTYLKTNNDPRLSVLFDSVGDDIIGMITGSYEAPSTEFSAPSDVARPTLTHNMPILLMTVAESELLQAEAHLRLGNTAMAQTHYELGVISSFERMGADTTGLLGPGGVYEFPSSNIDTMLEAIIMQKWVDAAEGQRGIESFIEWVRTGYPQTTPTTVDADIPVGLEADLPAEYTPGNLIYSRKGATGGRFPVRLPYAESEMNFNSNAAEYKNLPAADVMQTNVWWNR